MSDVSKKVSKEELRKKVHLIVDELPAGQLAVASVYLEGLLAGNRKAAAKPHQAAPRGSERRVFKRIKASIPVVYRSLEEPNHQKQVSSLDISSGGISFVFITEDEVNLSDYIELSFTLPGNRGSFTVQAQVRRAVKRRSGPGYEVGVEFFNVTEEQRKLINEFVKQGIGK